MSYNIFVAGNLRVCIRGFYEGKSDVTKLQRPLVKPKISNFLYTLLRIVFHCPISSRMQERL